MTLRPIRKVLVANRGEIAVRVFTTCRELSIGTVAVYSDADAQSPHRFAADEAVEIGPAQAKASYLRGDRIVEAALATHADAIHPGYGFLSENADFAAAVEKAGLVFIGPTSANIAAMGDKVRARALMRAAGMPVIPGSPGPIASERELEAIAREIGFPLLIKAAGGGGGKGIRRVDDASELRSAWQRASSEAGAAFGDRRVYVERLLPSARHIEAQILGDGKGGVQFFGERECSLQRHHQKIVEESPSPSIDEQLRNQIREAARRGVRALAYRGAGTFEFLFDEARRSFYFLEMNTRLQVEHAVTELVCQVDLVAEQIRIAAGGDLAGVEDPPRRGHAIEFRVCAEDPYRGFVPSIGTVQGLRLPHAPFTRIDAALRDGLGITPYYDSMLAKVIAWGSDRAQAIARLESLLRRTRISGLHTTLPLGVEICRWDDFRAGRFHTGTLEGWLAGRSKLPERPPALSALIGGILARGALPGAGAPALPAATTAGSAWGLAARLDVLGQER